MHTLTNERAPVVLGTGEAARAAGRARGRRDPVPARRCAGTRSPGRAGKPRARPRGGRGAAPPRLPEHGRGDRARRGRRRDVGRQVQMSIADQALGDACLDVLGPFATSPGSAPEGTSSHAWQHFYLHSRASSICGGTAQIRRTSLPSACSAFRAGRVDLELTPEQHELQSLALELLARRVPLAVHRSFLGGEGDVSDLWDDLAELGWYASGSRTTTDSACRDCASSRRSSAASWRPTCSSCVAVAARIVATAGTDETRSSWHRRDGWERARLARRGGARAQWAVPGSRPWHRARRPDTRCRGRGRRPPRRGVQVIGVVALLDGAASTSSTARAPASNSPSSTSRSDDAQRQRRPRRRPSRPRCRGRRRRRRRAARIRRRRGRDGRRGRWRRVCSARPRARIREREQFKRPIGTFQGVPAPARRGPRAGDGVVDDALHGRGSTRTSPTPRRRARS